MFSATKICVLLILLTGIASAGNDVIVNYNATDEIQQVMLLGGDDLITPQYHYCDEYFILYNHGNVKYMVYMDNYTGCHKKQFANNITKSYNDGFIGVIEPNQMIMLNNNATYRIYASYNTYRDLSDVETVKNRFNQWWLIIIIGIIVLAVIIKVLKVIMR
ncbi:MAG: hypothetical protein ACKVE3_06960 [Dissulfuribacterales bacterium]